MVLVILSDTCVSLFIHSREKYVIWMQFLKCIPLFSASFSLLHFIASFPHSFLPSSRHSSPASSFHPFTKESKLLSYITFHRNTSARSLHALHSFLSSLLSRQRVKRLSPSCPSFSIRPFHPLQYLTHFSSLIQICVFLPVFGF